jgi:Family of unknown function (DUF5701)
LTAAAPDDLPTRLSAEFDRQVNELVQLGYPQLAGTSDDTFLRRLTPLADVVPEMPAGDGDRIPFVVVPGEGSVSRVRAVGLTQIKGRLGFTSMEDDELKRFTPIADVEIPEGGYLLLDVDTGPETLNVVPDEALSRITGARRSPITIDEGLALITQFPGILRSRNCFSMLASRCGDRRVPALWVSRGRPRLGWCWAAAPHSWLGSASCGGRTGLK